MKAVIMAGGEGSRLRPLTCDIPKPMARLCGRPNIEYILELLEKHGVTEAVITLRYLPDEIIGHFPDSKYGKIKLNFCVEKQPLGTAGSVGEALRHSENSEPVLVISGDCLCDINLSAAMAHHEKTGADATLVVTRVSDPREYGLVVFSEDTTITGFIEKPGWNQTTTNAANTGIYILSPGTLSLIPKNTAYDFAGDLFPEMMARGRRLCVYETSSYWCDIGDLDTYRSCQQDMLRQRMAVRMPTESEGIFCPGTIPDGDFELIAPVYIGHHVTIGPGCVIGPGVVLDDGVTVGSMAKIRTSIVLPSAFIGDRARLTGAVVDRGASVKTGAFLFEGSMLGAGAVLGAGAQLMPGVRVWPGKKVEDGAKALENLRYGTLRPDFFDDEGISGEAGVDLTPEFCARVGAAAGSLKSGSRIGVACGGGRAARAFKSALVAGALSTGAQVWDFGEIMEAQMSFAVSFCGLSVAIYVSGGPTCCLKLMGEGGLPVTRSLERELTAHLSRGEFTRCSWNSFRDVADMSGVRLLYQQELYRQAPGGLHGMAAGVRCANREGERLFEDTLARLGCDTKCGPTLHLDGSGSRLALSDPSLGYIPAEKVLAMCCLIAFKSGEDAALPFEAPRILDALAEKFGRRLLRYVSSPADGSDKEARQAARGQIWLRDGMMSGIRLLSFLREQDVSLSALLAEIPQFATVMRYLEIDQPPSELIANLEGAAAMPEGVMLKRGEGSLLIRPNKRGKALKIIAEAVSMEAARDLCADLFPTQSHGAPEAPSLPTAPPGSDKSRLS